MPEVRIREFQTGFVIYFQTPEPSINAYALASTLVALSDGAKAAARTINGAVDLEIVVEALGSGSFRAKISAIARESGLFLKQQVITGVVVGVLASYVYDHSLGKKESLEVNVNSNEVLVTQGDTKIVIPRNVYDARQLVEKNPIFIRSMDRMLCSSVMDERVTGIGLAPDMSISVPDVIIPRALLEIRDQPPDDDQKTRTVEEDADLYIVKAIMERSRRKWEFKWRGVHISAPITDPNFYDEFARHNFTIAPGDEFQARLAIHQTRDDLSGVYSNTKYEVMRVYRHISYPRPTRLPLTAANGK